MIERKLTKVEDLPTNEAQIFLPDTLELEEE